MASSKPTPSETANSYGANGSNAGPVVMIRHGSQGQQTSASSSSSSSSSSSLPSSSSLSALQKGASAVRSSTERPIRTLLKYVEATHAPFQQTQTNYEIALFLYLVSHLLLQTYNIYGMNFYNYNIHLLSLCFAMVSKRLMANYFGLVKFWNPVSMSGSQLCANIILGSLIVINLSYLFVHLFNQHKMRDVLFLFYPLLVYAMMFGLEDAQDDMRRPSYMGNPQETEKVLVERMKRILYETFECGYYTGFVPMKFLPYDHLYYDPVRCGLLFGYVLINSYIMLLCQLLSTSFMELYLLSHSLGYWKRYKERRGDAPEWMQTLGPYKKNAVVKHKSILWTGAGQHNTCEPGRIFPGIFYFVFSNPGRTQKFLIRFQGLITVSLLGFVTNSSGWNVYAIMLLFNYYIFYQCLYCVKDPFLDSEIFELYGEYEKSVSPEVFAFPKMLKNRLRETSDEKEDAQSEASSSSNTDQQTSAPPQLSSSSKAKQANEQPAHQDGLKTSN